MCLGIPGKVVEIDASGSGKVDYEGTRVLTNFALLPGIKPGDWVIVHAGFAITRMNEKEARKTLNLLKEIEAKT